MEKIKTDGDIVRIARQMQILLDGIKDLIEEIETSEHPNKEAILARLNDNYIPVIAWPEHVVHSQLEYPECWETGDFGICAREKK
jgi:hypothetical protein